MPHHDRRGRAVLAAAGVDRANDLIGERVANLASGFEVERRSFDVAAVIQLENVLAERHQHPLRVDRKRDVDLGIRSAVPVRVIGRGVYDAARRAEVTAPHLRGDVLRVAVIERPVERQAIRAEQVRVVRLRRELLRAAVLRDDLLHSLDWLGIARHAQLSPASLSPIGRVGVEDAIGLENALGGQRLSLTVAEAVGFLRGHEMRRKTRGPRIARVLALRYHAPYQRRRAAARAHRR